MMQHCWREGWDEAECIGVGIRFNKERKELGEAEELWLDKNSGW